MIDLPLDEQDGLQSWGRSPWGHDTLLEALGFGPAICQHKDVGGFSLHSPSPQQSLLHFPQKMISKSSEHNWSNGGGAVSSGEITTNPQLS